LSKKGKKHPTEEKYPQQVAEYKKIVDDMYQLHLDKNREYSPNNIKVLGLLGCALRLLEKNIRVLNILGWDVWEGKTKETVKELKFDSIEKELDDLGNIPILMKILMRGKWGR